MSKKLERHEWEKEPFAAEYVEFVFNSIVGRVLTLIDASIDAEVKKRGMKDIVRSIIWKGYRDISSYTGDYNPPKREVSLGEEGSSKSH